jgi:hypothetical protein
MDQPINIVGITNIFQLLAIVIPSGFALLTAYLQTKSKKSIDDVKVTQTKNTEKIEDISTKQEVIHDAINSQQRGLIEAIKKASYAEGLLDGIKRDQTVIINSIMTELIHNDLIKKEQEISVEKIIDAAILAKDTLAKEAKINKERLSAEISKIKEDIFDELNKKFMKDR